jgi:hypothetical protein
VDGGSISCSPPPADQDLDGTPDVDDNCPTVYNANQADCDLDGVGDVCDTELDANENGIPDACEVSPPAGLVINEIRIDQPLGVDPDEYFELAGTTGTDLQGLTYIVIGDAGGDGAGGGIEAVVGLSSNIPGNPNLVDSNGYYVVGEATLSLGPSNKSAALNFENGDNVTHLLVTNFTGSNGMDLDLDDDGVIDSPAPWDAVVDAVGLVRTYPPHTPSNIPYGLSLGFVDVGPDVGEYDFVPAHVYRCLDDDSVWEIGPFDPFDPVPPGEDTVGADNEACGFVSLCHPCDIQPLPAGDNQITIADIIFVVTNFGNTNPTPADCNPPPDGVVSIADVTEVITAFGLTCPPFP